MSLDESSAQVLSALATYGLPGCPPLPRADDLTPTALVDAAEGVRLLGPMFDAVLNGDLDLPDDAAAYLVERHEANLLWCIELEVRLLELRDQFAAAGGVEHLVLKGPAIVHLDETDPSMRSFADIDVLVAARDIDLAVATLERSGAKRAWPQRRPGFDRRFAKSVTMTGTDNIEIDIHRMLCDGVFGIRVPNSELFASAEMFTLAGESIPALSRTNRLLHAAYHAVLGSPEPKLSSLRDLARYLASPDLGPAQVAPAAEHWNGTAVLATAIEATLTRLTFDAPNWRQWLTTVRVPQRELSLVARQRHEGSSFGRAKVDMWRELRGVRRFQYVAAVAIPSAEHLRARGMRRTDAIEALVRDVTSHVGTYR